MEAFRKAKRMEHVHSDIRGPLYMEALEMQKKGMDILKLNTGNPAVFGFEVPESVKSFAESAFDGTNLECIDARSCTLEQTGSIPETVKLLE